MLLEMIIILKTIIIIIVSSILMMMMGDQGELEGDVEKLLRKQSPRLSLVRQPSQPISSSPL